MTPIDRFERDLPVALADLADEPVPDYFIDILGQTARSRQRPAWAIPGRWFQMPGFASRPAFAAVVVAIVVILGGGMLYLRNNDQGVGAPSSSPSPTASPSPYPSPLALPSALVGGWLAPQRPSPIEQGQNSVIVFGALDGNPDAPDFAIASSDLTALADVREISPGVVELTSTGSLGGCSIGDVGHYRWSVSEDGAWLTLDQVDEACENRSGIVPGTWVRSGSLDNRGGALVSAVFEPMFSFTLPEGDWLAASGAGVLTLDHDAATFKVWQDPDGFNDYCNDALGRKVLERGIDPFLKFLREDSGLNASNERETTIDGHRAVIVDIVGKPDIPPPCWTNPDSGETNMILQWTQHADVGWNWATIIGGMPWPIVVTEVNGHTLVFEDIKGGNVLDQSILDSIRFIDALPTPPTS